jgi:3-O-methylgallate 3,4-dioxygenase
MAEIVLGMGTSHTPLLSLAPELWETYAQRDIGNPELAYPPHGWVMSYQEALDYLPAEVKAKYQGTAPFAAQAAAFKRALDTLASTLDAARPDVTIIISDDQDEWFYDHNMPRFSIYWGDTVPLRPRPVPPGGHPEINKAMVIGYGDVPMEVPVASVFGRYLLEYLCEHDFDISYMTHAAPSYGGTVARRYPTKNGELDAVRETPDHEQGLPHGFAFIIKRLFDNKPGPIVPFFQNTCYPPNQPSPSRSFALGEAVADAIRAWDSPARVAIVASGGLSHFVVDEELDRNVLSALKRKDAEALKATPRERLYSAASETLNWIAVGGAMQRTDLKMELLDYVPVYRTPAATGGGWAFAQWR